MNIYHRCCNYRLMLINKQTRLARKYLYKIKEKQQKQEMEFFIPGGNYGWIGLTWDLGFDSGLSIVSMH